MPQALELLDLSGNRVGAGGSERLMEALADWRVVVQLE